MFYENRLGIKKSVISLFTWFCPNTGTKFRGPCHSNHVIPHRDYRRASLLVSESKQKSAKVVFLDKLVELFRGVPTYLKPPHLLF